MTPPPGSRGTVCFQRLCPFPCESADVYQIWCQSVQPFGRFSTFLFLTPNPPPNAPWCIEGLIVLAYVHSQMNPQTCTKFGANRSSRLVGFPDFCLFDHLNPQNSPLGIEGLIVFSIYVHSQMNLQMFTKFGANRSSRLVDFPDFCIL